MDANKPMSVMFLEGREEVRDAERRVADARVQALVARHEVRLTRLAAAFATMRHEINAAFDRIEAQINAPISPEEK